MYHQSKLQPLCLSAILLLFFSFVSKDSSAQNQDSASWFISMEWWAYRSFSQQKPTTPIKAGYPVIESQSAAIGIGHTRQRAKAHHQFKLSASIPSSLSSDNGTGQNLLLEQNSHTYFRSGLDYRMSYILFEWKGFRARHGVVSGLFYENRSLHFSSGAREKTEDINLYIGPGVLLKHDFLQNWTITGTFDGRFYLPYTNYGQLTAWETDGIRRFSFHYRGFYYQTIFNLDLAYETTQNRWFHIGLVKNDVVGFASRKPSFYVSEVVHFKLDRLFHYYLRYQF